MPELDLLTDAAVGSRIALPPPKLTSRQPVEKMLYRRRSMRKFAADPLSLAEIGQLLWAAQGVTSPHGLRTAPSAGAMYPLEVYLLCAAGMLRYLPGEHALQKIVREDVRATIAKEGHADAFLARAPVALLFTAVYERTTRRYGDRGIRYVHIDLGHAAQNVHLQAEAMNLASVALGAFADAEVAKAARLPVEERPLYIIPVGRRG